MPRYCAICKFSSNGLQFFTVPKNENRRRRWIESCGFELKYPSRVCQKHFDDEDFISPPGNENNKRCRLMPGARPMRFFDRSKEKGTEHWYDLKMKVKNKLIRRQEAYNVPGTVKIPEHMELTDDEQYVANFVKNMDGMEEIVEEALQSTTTPRTRDQTAVLLKLVHTNKVNFKKNDMAGRQAIWMQIAETLNRMPGPEKTIDGWKKAYWSWRLQAGDDYEKELERWIQRAPEIPAITKKYKEDFDIDNTTLYKKLVTDDIFDEEQKLSDTQTQRLYELVSEQKALLQTGINDEPMKKQIWTNIANELNNLPGVSLSIEEWRERGDWSKLVLQRERKKHQQNNKNNQNMSGPVKTKPNHDVISFGPEDVNNIEFEIMDSQSDIEKMQHIDDSNNPFSNNFDGEDTQDYTFEDNSQDEYIYDDEFGSDHDFLYTNDEQEDEIVQQRQQQTQQEQQPQLLEQNNVNADDDTLDYEPQEKRLKVTSPIVKSFKFSNRIVTAVEKLSADVSDMKETLTNTANSLASIEQIMERQNEKQDETNALLKRNNQLLKILIEYKTGKRKNTHN